MDLNPTTIFAGKPRVLISSCLLGESVRYDGGHKRLEHLQNLVLPWITVVSHCPEMAAGMGVPREPIQLQQSESAGATIVEARQVSDPSINLTAQINSAAERWLANTPPPVAALLKARSPSCGKGTTPIYDTDGHATGLDDGLFVWLLRRKYPKLTILDEHCFATEDQCRRFVIGCHIEAAQQSGIAVQASILKELGWQPGSSLKQFLETN